MATPCLSRGKASSSYPLTAGLQTTTRETLDDAEQDQLTETAGHLHIKKLTVKDRELTRGNSCAGRDAR